MKGGLVCKLWKSVKNIIFKKNNIHNEKVSNAIAFVNSFKPKDYWHEQLSLISKEDGKNFHLCDRPECWS